MSEEKLRSIGDLKEVFPHLLDAAVEFALSECNNSAEAATSRLIGDSAFMELVESKGCKEMPKVDETAVASPEKKTTIPAMPKMRSPPLAPRLLMKSKRRLILPLRTWRPESKLYKSRRSCCLA